MYPFVRGFGRPTTGMMDDPYDNLSFDQEEEENPYQIPEAPQPPPAINFMDAYRELMNRQSGPAMSAYSKFLTSGYPKEEDYKPSKLTRLGAILSGMAAGYQNPASGFETTRSIIERPYERAVRRYGQEGARLREAANLEEQGFRSKVQATKDYIDAQNKDADNQRQAKAAEILNQSRILGMEKTRLELKKIGLETHIDPVSGNLIGINVLTGAKTDFGKIGSGEADRVSEFGKKADITLKNRKAQTLFEAPLIEGRQKRLQDDRQAFTREQQDRTFANQKDLIAERARTRAKLPEASAAKIRNNQFKVQSIVDANPEKYADLWTGEGLTTEVPEKGTAEFEAFKTLYNALYEGTAAIQSFDNVVAGSSKGKTVGKYEVKR